MSESSIAPLELGLHLGSRLDPRRTVDLAVKAEAAGLASVWISEDLFFHGAFATAGAVAQATDHIQIGFGVLAAYNRHPSLVAMELVSLARLAGPRVVLGIGAGVNARLERIGIDTWRPLPAVRETVALVRGLLAGETMTLDGAVHHAVDLQLDTPVLSRRPALYVAAVGPRALVQAGQVADGVVLTMMCSLRHAAAACEAARSSALAAGRNAEMPAVAYLPMSVDDDSATAVARLKPLIAYYITRWAPIPSLRALFTAWGVLDDAAVDRLTAALEAGERPENVIDDELVRAYCIAGTLAECREQLAAFARAGVTVAAIELGDDPGQQDRTVQALASLTGSSRLPGRTGQLRPTSELTGGQ